MSDGKGPSAGDIIGGVVITLFSLCILLVGGGCTTLWVLLLLDERGATAGNMGTWVMLGASLLIAAVGLLGIVQGVRMFRPKR